jgi:hypothetical protein
MPDISDFKKRLKEIEEAILQKLPEIAISMTLSAKALAERQIKDAGFGAKYSQNKIPAWFLHGKELNQKGTKFLEDHGVDAGTGKQGEAKKKRRKKKGDPDPGKFDTLTNWSEFRAAQGLQVAHVDGSYSNKMWANMQPLKPYQSLYIIYSPLGATNTEAQAKMNYMRDRYGDFIGKAITEENRQILTDLVADEVVKVISEFLPSNG